MFTSHLGESHDASVCNRLAFDQPYPPEFGECCELLYTGIGQPVAASQIDISYSVAHLHKLDDRCVCNLRAMTEMNVMQILAEPGDGMHGSIRKILALGKDEVA